jgi:DNA-binding NarL/FixJ family response regulator
MILNDEREVPVSLKKTVYIAISTEGMADANIKDLSKHYNAKYCQSITDLMVAIDKAQPDLILCHEDLIEDKPISSITLIKSASPTSRILVIGHGRAITGQIALLKLGARGYFDQQLPLQKLDFAIEGILHGEVWIERHVISGLIDELNQVVVPAMTEQQHMALASLTPKEHEVATLVSHGATNKMIANQMVISERTVKAHLTTVFHKMTISDRLSLAIFFRDLR